MAIDLKRQSPLGIYLEHCAKGELAYQVCTDDGEPVFYPRAVAPGTGRPIWNGGCRKASAPCIRRPSCIIKASRR